MAKKTSLSDPLGIRVKDHGLNRDPKGMDVYPEHPMKMRIIRAPALETRGYTRAADSARRVARETPKKGRR